MQTVIKWLSCCLFCAFGKTVDCNWCIDLCFAYSNTHTITNELTCCFQLKHFVLHVLWRSTLNPVWALPRSIALWSVKVCLNWVTLWQKLSYAICEQQRRRSTCVSAQSDLFCSLLRQYNICSCYIQSFKTLTGLCSWVSWFEPYLVANPEDKFSRDMAQWTKNKDIIRIVSRRSSFTRQPLRMSVCTRETF